MPAGTVGIEAQIEDAAGLAAVEAIAASPRGWSRSSSARPTSWRRRDALATVGGQPEGYAFDAHHYALMRMLVAARANGLQAIDGPYAKIGDEAGLRAAATSVAALGFDGKWVLHPGQVDVVNEVSPRRRRTMPARSASSTPISRRPRSTSAARSMLDDEMIDETSRKMALAIAAKGAAAGCLAPASFRARPRTAARQAGRR